MSTQSPAPVPAKPSLIRQVLPWLFAVAILGYMFYKVDFVKVWETLAVQLEIHASAEEQHFYPSMARRADDEEDSATEDAIGDHNEIREGVAKARQADIGSQQWWDAIDETDRANNDHMAEEERDDLAPFRAATSLSFRQELGAKFEQFKVEHAEGYGLSFADKDPGRYVEAVTSSP